MGISVRPSALRSTSECLDAYLREVANLPVLAPAGERSLTRRAARGDIDARRELITSNLRLVVKIAAQYANYGVALCDLIQEGNLGLIKAVERFDWRRGTRFSTYAAFWIREAITRALTHGGHAVRLTGHAFRRFRDLANTTETLTTRLQREPTTAEIAAAMEMTSTRTTRIVSAAAFPISLDDPLNGHEGTTPLEEIACECGCDPSAVVQENLGSGQVQHAITRVLSSREQWVIIHSFGLDGNVPKKLKDMATGLGVSLERVRQIRNRALSKLRQHLTPRDLGATA